MKVVGANAIDAFVGSEAEPRQVVRIVVRGTDDGDGTSGRPPARLSVRGDRIRASDRIAVGPLVSGQEVRVELGVVADPAVGRGERLPAEVVLEGEGVAVPASFPFDLVAAEPGWRLFMVAHFHYDPVWWNTQAAYTETWGRAIAYRQPFQEPGLALVKAHLEEARRDPLYKFVLAELDYLKPYWDAYPEDREYFRQLIAEGRLELVGGTYNEPNTNLTSAESTIRNAIYGIGYQRDVLGGSPATAWQLDVFGHDPQFPGMMADAGLSSSSWARGPFHEWGPHWVRGPARLPFAELATGERPRMQFPTEFDWVAPSGRALLTAFQADHYSSGWWMDAAASLEAAEEAVYGLFTDLAPLAATRNVLLPVGTDYSPPNRWLTAIARDWNARYVWPKFLPAVPRDFFAAVRAERAATGRGFVPQTRDMNPIYTGKDVSFIDTKQAQRTAENLLLAAEKFATLASLAGARFPWDATDKAWRQLLFGAHHDGITGSESDQVYLDLLGGWREANELAAGVLDDALVHLGGQIDTDGEGEPLVVFNPLSWPRTDVARVALDLGGGWPGRALGVRDSDGNSVPFALDALERAADGRPRRVAISFVATGVPALGWRTYRLVPTDDDLDAAGWRSEDGTEIENERYRVVADPGRGGAISSIADRLDDRELLSDGGLANELLVTREYPSHPLFGEGPWHLTPDGRTESAASSPAAVLRESSPIGERLRVAAPFVACRRVQEVTVWHGVERIELATRIEEFSGHDQLFRVRFRPRIPGARPVSEVGNAVVGRPFGRPLVDVAEVPFTLDHPAYNWFALGTTARIVPHSDEAPPDGRSAGRGLALSVAEVVAPDDPSLDDPLRELLVALVRSGVTATLTGADGPRYGVLHIDSNLPDIRIAVGSPERNAFTAAVLAAADERFGAELDRQIRASGAGLVLVPADPRPVGPSDPIPDARGARDLPVLVVAAADDAALAAAVRRIVEDLADSAIALDQGDLADALGPLDDATFAVLNRGIPGFNVEADGSMYLSLLRSSSGWPSGVWIDPPRRSTPDGANFQFEHWSHTFEYAIAASAVSWRDAGTARIGHEYNNPLLVRRLDGHPGPLPRSASLLRVEPPSVVATALKPAGNPLSRMADGPDVPGGVALRVYESSGRDTVARVTTGFPFDPRRVGLLEDETPGAEETSAPATVRRVDAAAGLDVALAPFEIATIAGTAGTIPASPRRVTQPRVLEPAQPVFADYWMHNKGAAPVGYQPLAVSIRPWLVRGPGPYRLPISVASEKTDGPIEGVLSIEAPDGWTVDPTSRPFRLAPGAHFAFEALVTPPAGGAPGRYFVSARVDQLDGQAFEDVVTVDYLPGGEDPAATRSAERSPSLAAAVDRALRGGEPVEEPTRPGSLGDLGRPDEELRIELRTDRVDVGPGGRATVRLGLRNLVSSAIRGEAQILSPHETWPFVRPWSQGFSVGPGEDCDLEFAVAPGVDTAPGTWWALVKVMYFGRVAYTSSIPLVVAERAVEIAR